MKGLTKNDVDIISYKRINGTNNIIYYVISKKDSKLYAVPNISGNFNEIDVNSIKYAMDMDIIGNVSSFGMSLGKLLYVANNGVLIINNDDVPQILTHTSRYTISYLEGNLNFIDSL